jgi:hypothetical protein
MFSFISCDTVTSVVLHVSITKLLIIYTGEKEDIFMTTAILSNLHKMDIFASPAIGLLYSSV